MASNQNKTSKRNDKRTPAHSVSLSCWLGNTAAVDVSLKCLELAVDLIKNSNQYANSDIITLSAQFRKFVSKSTHS